MGYRGINWIKQPEREEEENTSMLLDNRDIQAGSIVDIRAGSGY